MLRKKWEELHKQFGFTFNWGSAVKVDEKDPVRMVVMNTKRKGQVGTFTGFDGGKAVLRLDDGAIVKVPYKHAEMADAEGRPILDVPHDVLRQEVKVGSLICYSVGTTHGHNFEIGRVSSISEIGFYTVRVLVREGKVVEQGAYQSTRSGIKPHHCLRIPVEDTVLMTAVMTDFSSILSDHYE